MQHSNKYEQELAAYRKNTKGVEKDGSGMKLVGEEIISTLEDLTLKGTENEYKPCSDNK